MEVLKIGFLITLNSCFCNFCIFHQKAMEWLLLEVEDPKVEIRISSYCWVVHVTFCHKMPFIKGVRNGMVDSGGKT